MKKFYYFLILLFLSTNLLAQVSTLSEGFDVVPPTGWTRNNLSNPLGTGVWGQGNPSNFNSHSGATNSYATALWSSTTSTGVGTISNWLITPELNLQNGATLQFWTTTAPGTTQYPDRLQVRLSTSGSSTNVGTSETSVGDFSTLLLDINPTYSTTVYPRTWTQFTVTLSGIPASATGRIAFRYFVENGGGGAAATNSNVIGLDDVSYSATSCSTPTGGTVSGPSSACDNTNFNLTLSGYTPVAGVDIKWQSSPVGANTWTDIPGATSASAAISQTGPRDYRATVACSGGGSPVPSTNIITVAQNTTTCPPSCTNNISPANAATNVSYQPSISFSWAAATGATSYDFYIGTTPTPALLGNYTNTSVNLSGANPNTTYYWYVVPKNANGTLNNCSSSVTSFTTGAPAPPPANDECANAVTLTAYMGATGYSGTTVGSTASAGIVACGSVATWGTPDDDVWFKFTPVQNGDATITVIGAGSFDAVIQLFSGSCGALVQEGTCKDATAAGGTETMTATGLIAGQTYYLRIYDWDDGEIGNFAIRLSGTALPVSLTNFTGRIEKSNNILNWSTSSEINNSGFELERSADGRSFSKIAFVASKADNGNSNTQLSYSFADEKPLSGTNYYRLKQVDKDGKFMYSDVVVLKNKITDFKIANLYPNPAKSEVKMIITATNAGRATIVVSDLTGKMISQIPVQLAIGENNQTIKVQSLANGTYMIKVIGESGVETAVQRFVKH